jgi:hypothetical protein
MGVIEVTGECGGGSCDLSVQDDKAGKDFFADTPAASKRRQDDRRGSSLECPLCPPNTAATFWATRTRTVRLMSRSVFRNRKPGARIRQLTRAQTPRLGRYVDARRALPAQSVPAKATSSVPTCGEAER